MDIRNTVEAAIKKELMNIYKKVDEEIPSDDYFNDCIQIGAFLMNKEAVYKSLIKLNTLLRSKFEETQWNGAFDEKGVYRKGAMKLLRNLLEDELAPFGFQPKFAQVTGQLDEEEFGKLLSDGWMLKDSAFRGLGSSGHGEFSHAIQWLLIAWYWQEHKEKFHHEIIKIYKTIATPLHLDGEIKPNASLWFVLVDSAGEDQFFRAPEEMTKFFYGNTDKNIKLLCELLTHEKEYQNLNEKLKNKLKFYQQSDDVNNKYKKSDVSSSVIIPNLPGRKINKI